MTMKDLANAARAAEPDLRASEAIAIAEAVIGEIETSMRHDGYFRINGFGTFKTVLHKAREGRNPQTGEKIWVPAKNVIRFIPAKALKGAMNPPARQRKRA